MLRRFRASYILASSTRHLLGLHFPFWIGVENGLQGMVGLGGFVLLWDSLPRRRRVGEGGTLCMHSYPVSCFYDH